MNQDKMYLINKLFNNDTIRTVWDKEEEKYYVSAVDVVGVVFAKTNDGFYLSDGTTGLYAKLADSQSSKLATLKLGDEVKLSGKLSVAASQIFVKNANVEVLSSGKTPVSASATTIEAVQALAASDRANYGKLFNLTGAISLDEANRMFWTDSTGTILFDDSCKQAFADQIGKKISAKAIILALGRKPKRMKTDKAKDMID